MYALLDEAGFIIISSYNKAELEEYKKIYNVNGEIVRI